MKSIIIIVSFIFIIYNSYGQKGVKFEYEICNDIVNANLTLKYEKEFVRKYFKFNRSLSFSYYVDFRNYQHYKINYVDSDSISIVPYQYVLLYDVVDAKGKIISTFKMSCFYRNGSLRLEKNEYLKDFLSPQIKVINGKVLSLEKVLEIAKNRGCLSTPKWSIDYEKNKNNKYKWFFPRLIWTLKENVNNEKESYTKVIQINAKNGKILNEFKKYRL